MYNKYNMMKTSFNDVYNSNKTKFRNVLSSIYTIYSPFTL